MKVVEKELPSIDVNNGSWNSLFCKERGRSLQDVKEECRKVMIGRTLRER
jgi:hypothetical protein